jgi:putative transposase
VFAVEGIRILASPLQAPRANAMCDRIIGSLCRELLDQMLIVNEHHLRRVLTEYLQHSDTVRHHRSLGQLTSSSRSSSAPPSSASTGGVCETETPSRCAKCLST